jgi:hypothetical protein
MANAENSGRPGVAPAPSPTAPRSESMPRHTTTSDAAAPEGVAARIAMLLDGEREARERRKAERQRRIRNVLLVSLIPLVLLTLFMLVQFLRR